MEQTYGLTLTPLQIEVLRDAAGGFVDNKKLLHVPTADGEVVGLPLTEEALSWLLNACGEADNKQDITVQLAPTAGEKTEVIITCLRNEVTWSYEVSLAEFDEQ